MWILFGVASGVFTVVSLILGIRKKNITWSVLCALGFTTLTMLAEYGMVNAWVLEESWASLMDVVPTMHTALTIYVVLAIVLNTAALLLSRFLTKP